MGEARVDRIDRLGGAVGQRRGEVGKARVEQVDRLRGAVGQRRGQRAETVVDGFGDRLRPRIEILFERFESAVDRFVEVLDLAVERGVEASILPSSEVSRLATRLPSVVSNCTRRWSSEAVISPPFEVRRVSKVST